MTTANTPAVAATQTGAGSGLIRSTRRLATAITAVTTTNSATAAIGVSSIVTTAVRRRGSL
ncbi:Uncharacterised protein [Mycobacterium tuberculosis]|nr:Uncharacterised protein [Mycobacterium tuberculosis]